MSWYLSVDFILLEFIIPRQYNDWRLSRGLDLGQTGPLSGRSCSQLGLASVESTSCQDSESPSDADGRFAGAGRSRRHRHHRARRSPAARTASPVTRTRGTAPGDPAPHNERVTLPPQPTCRLRGWFGSIVWAKAKRFSGRNPCLGRLLPHHVAGHHCWVMAIPEHWLINLKEVNLEPAPPRSGGFA